MSCEGLALKPRACAPPRVRPSLSKHVPERDAVRSRGSSAAGAVDLRQDEPADSTQATCRRYNVIFGTTNNPWDATRTPGGSSGGCGGGARRGAHGVELGSDIGGSIRIPRTGAASTGTSRRGHRARARPHTRTARRASPRRTSTSSGRWRAAPTISNSPSGSLPAPTRLGWSPGGCSSRRPGAPRSVNTASPHGSTIAACPIDRGVRERLEAAVGALRTSGRARRRRGAARLHVPGRGAHQRAAAQPDYGCWRTGRCVRGDGRSRCHSSRRRSIFAGPLPAQLDAAPSRLAPGERAPCPDARAVGGVLRRVLFVDVSGRADDGLSSRSQPGHGRTDRCINGEPRSVFDGIWWAGFVGVCYLPATVAPVGRARDGLPVGVQIVGPYLEDHTTIDFARRLSDVIGGDERPPGFE